MRVDYRDARGLIALGDPLPGHVEALAGALFGESASPEGLAAKLADYMDTDNRRRFAGGERADYRLRNMAPPGDGPLRDHREIYRVLGWRDAMDMAALERLRDLTTLNVSGGVNPYFAHPDVAALLARNELSIISPGGDPIDEFAARDSRPSQVGRFRFLTRVGASGLDRGVEIQRLPASAERPYRRTLVYDRAAPSDAGATPPEGAPDVVQP